MDALPHSNMFALLASEELPIVHCIYNHKIDSVSSRHAPQVPPIVPLAAHPVEVDVKLDGAMGGGGEKASPGWAAAEERVLGDCAMSANRRPATMPAHGRVMTHPITAHAGLVSAHDAILKEKKQKEKHRGANALVHATMRQLTASSRPVHRPTPTVAPVMQCVVLTAAPTEEAHSTVVNAASSMENPRLGEWYVMLLPRERITL